MSFVSPTVPRGKIFLRGGRWACEAKRLRKPGGCTTDWSLGHIHRAYELQNKYRLINSFFLQTEFVSKG